MKNPQLPGTAVLLRVRAHRIDCLGNLRFREPASESVGAPRVARDYYSEASDKKCTRRPPSTRVIDPFTDTHTCTHVGFYLEWEEGGAVVIGRKESRGSKFHADAREITRVAERIESIMACRRRRRRRRGVEGWIKFRAALVCVW